MYNHIVLLTPAQLTPPHYAGEMEREIGGYTIPADAHVFASLYTVHFDERYWRDPHKITLDRWLDDKGNPIKHGNHFLPFSVGMSTTSNPSRVQQAFCLGVLRVHSQ